MSKCVYLISLFTPYLLISKPPWEEQVYAFCFWATTVSVPRTRHRTWYTVCSVNLHEEYECVKNGPRQGPTRGMCLGRGARSLAPAAPLVGSVRPFMCRLRPGITEDSGCLFMLFYTPLPSEMTPSHTGRELMFISIYHAPSPAGWPALTLLHSHRHPLRARGPVPTSQGVTQKLHVLAGGT